MSDPHMEMSIVSSSSIVPLNLISLLLLRFFIILTYLLSKDIKMGTLESIVYITFMVNVHGSLFLYPYVLLFYIFFCFKFIVLGHYNFGFFKNST